MKGIAITHIGIEDVCAKEISELIKARCTVQKGCVIFEFSKFEDLFLLCYKAQSVIRILYSLGSFKAKKIEDVEKEARKIDFSEFVDKNISFASRCLRVGKQPFGTNEVESVVGGIVNDKTNARVNLNAPDVTVFSYFVDDSCYIGIDFAGFDLSKRSYRIYVHPAGLKGTIAYALLRIAGYDKTGIVVDPFCGSGTICIEAGLFSSGRAVRFFDKDGFAFLKFKKFAKFDFNKFFNAIDKKIKRVKGIFGYDSSQVYLSYAQKNSKIAGVVKDIKFAKADVESLELNFKKNEVDFIVTNPPAVSKKLRKEAAEKTYKEFFYQANYVLKKNGKIVCISTSTDTLKSEAEKQEFAVSGEREIFSGGQLLKVVGFERKK